MTALAGIGASCSEASTAFTNASKWSLSIKNATKEVTPFGAAGNFAINIPTINSWTAKITAFLDTSDTAQTTIFAAIGTTIAITLKVDGTHSFTGNAIVSGLDPSVDVQSAETVDIAFTGTGAVTYS